MIALFVLASLLAGSIAPVSAAEWNGRFSIWRSSAFATQYWDYSCVGATIQIMLNLIHGRSDESRNRQDEYLDFAQAESRYEVTDQGADPEGWAQAMVRYGGGDDYGWAAAPTAQESLRVAARQMRETEKPVGLLVHLGRHAWVMTGFESTADPALTEDFEVTAAEVVGPLWPHGTLNGTIVRSGTAYLDGYPDPVAQVRHICRARPGGMAGPLRDDHSQGERGEPGHERPRRPGDGRCARSQLGLWLGVGLPQPGRPGSGARPDLASLTARASR